MRDAWANWRAGESLRSTLGDGDQIVLGEQQLTMIGRAGLIECDLLGDDGLVSIQNREVLRALRSLPGPSDR